MSVLLQGRSYLVRAALLLTFLGSSTTAFAVTIFEVRKRLPMKNGEKTHRDFYINGGAESGLKAGMILRVNRQVTLYDSYQNKSPGDLLIPVGELKVISAQKGVSVARLYRIFERNNLPVLEENFLMVGDEVDVGSARMDRAPKGKKTSVKTGPPAPQPAGSGSATSASISPQNRSQSSQGGEEPGVGSYLP